MFRSSGEKMAISFIKICNVAVTIRVSITKKGTNLFIKGILNQNKMFQLD